ncbi:hypothetical protein D3C81_1749650 [compost metagenome]
MAVGAPALGAGDQRGDHDQLERHVDADRRKTDDRGHGICHEHPKADNRRRYQAADQQRERRHLVGRQALEQ